MQFDIAAALKQVVPYATLVSRKYPVTYVTEHPFVLMISGFC